MTTSPPASAATTVGETVDPSFDAVHALALRTSASPLPPGGEALLARGLAEASGPGYLLTSEGYRVHRVLLDRERAGIDIVTLGMAYAPVATLSRRLLYLRERWRQVPADRADLVAPFHAFAADAEVPLLRSAAIVPRFASYVPRLRDAAGRLRDGDLRFAIDRAVGSIALTWDDLHEDYLQTLGRGHEMEEL